jgi:transposase
VRSRRAAHPALGEPRSPTEESRSRHTDRSTPRHTKLRSRGRRISQVNRPGMSGDFGVSRVLRGVDFWILVPDTRRPSWEDGGYPPEFRRKVLDLLEDGRSVAQVAHDLDISEQSIYTWRRQDRIDRGLASGLTSKEKSELTTARKRIAELETELKAARRAVELLREESSPKGGSRRSR